MKLLHIMPLEVYQNTLEQGLSYQAKLSLMDLEPQWAPAYSFMKSKLLEKVPLPQVPGTFLQEIYPTWAWPLEKLIDFKVDCRQRFFKKWGPPGANYMCVVFEKKEQDVLLSDFDCWHFALNQQFLCLEEQTPLEAPLALLEKSWTQIFDDKFLAEFHKTSENNYSIFWQAVCWGIQPQEIVKTKKFTCR